MTISPVYARDDPINAHLPHVNQPQTILGTTIAFLAVAVLAASLRLWSRLKDHLWGLDDAFVFLSTAVSIAGDSMVCMMVFDGLGLHSSTLHDDEKQALLKHIWSSNSAYCASTTFIKLSILFQYKRLFAETTTSTTSAQYRLAQRCIWSSIIISGTWGFSFTILALFPCRPIAKNWDLALDGKCIGWGSKDPNKFFGMWAAHAATNMFLDIVILLLPLPFLGVLRLGEKSRVGLVALFALGGVVALVSVGRMIALCINRAGTVPVMDVPYYTPAVYIFSVLEVNMAIICASIPIFWPAISSFAANKILVVNEIVVHVEQYPKSSLDGQPGIGLAEQGAWKSPPETPRAASQQSHRLSTMMRSMDRRSHKDGSTEAKHRSRGSIASTVRKSVSRNEGSRTATRTSQDSQRNLYKSTTQESSSLAKSDYDWFTELDRECVGKRTVTRIEKGDPFSPGRPSGT